MKEDFMNTIGSIGCERTSERAVIIQAQQGKPEAFQLLYQRYNNYVSGQCRRLGCDPVVTEDLTQDVFFQLWKKIAGFKGQSALRTWLHRITVNVVFSHFRSQRQNSLRVEFTSPSGESIDLTDRFYEMPCSLDDHVLISQILSSLSPIDRRIVLLHTAGFKHREIARILRIPHATSRSQLFRVRAKIRKFNDMAPLAIKHSTPVAA
jgi:RNA polymerase sigma-70 factor (ECF subfamily)